MFLTGVNLFRQFRSVEADDRRGAAHEPEWSNKEIDRVFEKGRLISFDRVSHELQNPADDEHPQRPPPVEKEEWQRYDDHRYADTMSKTVQRVLVLGFVVSEEIL